MMTEKKYRMFLSRNLDREKREKKIQDTQTRIWSLPLYKVENCLTSILNPKRGTDMDFYGTSLQQYYTTKHVCCNLSGEPVILTT